MLEPFKFHNLFVDDGKGAGGTVGELTKEDTINFLKEEDDEKEVLDLKDSKEKDEKELDEEKDDDKDEKEEKEKEDEEKDELSELEEELEEPDESKLELTTPVRRKEILSKYPKLFKDFPYLEKAYYREQQFTEIVPTIADAKEAVEKAGILDKYELDLSKGELQKSLEAVKASGEQAFHNLVDNYLINLGRIDKDAYHHVIGNIIKQTTSAMITEASESNDPDLKAAAEILTKFIFGTTKVGPPTALSKKTEDRPEEDALKKREREFLERQYETARESLNTRVTNVLKSTIEDNIDPKQSMTDYVRKNAARDCQEKLESLIAGDKRLGNLVGRLWQQAAKDNFSKTSTDKIKSAVLSVAKTLLPTVIKQARNEALKGLGKRVKDDNEDDQPKKGPIAPGRSTSQESHSSGKSEREKAKAIPAGMSTRDYLNSD